MQYRSQSGYALNLFMCRIDVNENIHKYWTYGLNQNGLESKKFVSGRSTVVYSTKITNLILYIPEYFYT